MGMQEKTVLGPELVNDVAVLFARRDSVYKQLVADVYDEDRNALTYSGKLSVITHPPCRGWGQLRGLANPAPGEKELAIWSVEQVRKLGGGTGAPAQKYAVASLQFARTWAR